MDNKDGKFDEADNASGVGHAGQRANFPVQRLTATSIVGDKVENPNSESLGKIDNLMINLKSGQVEYAVVEMGSFLGIGSKLFAVPFTELHADHIKKVFILNRTKEYLKNIPGFDKTHWPDTNAHAYYQDVNTYWSTSYQSSDY